MAAISAWATSGQAFSSIGPDLSGNPQRNTAGCDKAETQRKQCKWWNPACHAEPAPGSALTGLLQTLSSASASYSPYQENSFPQVTNIYSAYWFYLNSLPYCRQLPAIFTVLSSFSFHYFTVHPPMQSHLDSCHRKQRGSFSPPRQHPPVPEVMSRPFWCILFP